MRIRILLLTLLMAVGFVLPNYAKAAEDEKVDYVPKIYGAVKAKFETSAYDGKMRFNVRNSRVGFKGNVSHHINYNLQVDYNNEGKIGVLDAYVAYERERFGFTLGQHHHNFNSDLGRGPAQIIFANRSLLSKFVAGYHGIDDVSSDGGLVSYYVKNLGSRDIGFSGYYKLKDFPLKFTAGVFGGSGVNNPEWTSTVNFVARIDYGTGEGFGMAVSHYNGRTAVEERSFSYYDITGALSEFETNNRHGLRMWNAEVSYKGRNYWVEGSYAQRRQTVDKKLSLMSAAYVQGYYQFEMPAKCEIKYIAPALRWDYGHNMEFASNLIANKMDRFSANRVTAGVNFGFNTKLIGAELRLNFEKFFVKNKGLRQVSNNPFLQDKISIELIASF